MPCRELAETRNCEGCTKPRHYLDHGQVWGKDRRIACITGQPYGLSETDVAQLAADAEEFDLAVNVSSWAWYDRATVLIELRPRKGAR
jgi:hypothetical protein